MARGGTSQVAPGQHVATPARCLTMAISKTVYYSPDRRYRITVDSQNRSYRVERDLVLVHELTSLPMLESWLRENGFDLADLIED